MTPLELGLGWVFVCVCVFAFSLGSQRDECLRRDCISARAYIACQANRPDGAKARFARPSQLARQCGPRRATGRAAAVASAEVVLPDEERRRQICPHAAERVRAVGAETGRWPHSDAKPSRQLGHSHLSCRGQIAQPAQQRVGAARSSYAWRKCSGSGFGTCAVSLRGEPSSAPAAARPPQGAASTPPAPTTSPRAEGTARARPAASRRSPWPQRAGAVGPQRAGRHASPRPDDVTAQTWDVYGRGCFEDRWG